MDGVAHQHSSIYPGLWTSHRPLAKSWSSKTVGNGHQPLTRSRTLPPVSTTAAFHRPLYPSAPSSVPKLLRKCTTSDSTTSVINPPFPGPKEGEGGGGGNITSRTRLSSDTAFSEVLDSSDGDNGEGSCFSADVESSDDSGESSWDDRVTFAVENGNVCGGARRRAVVESARDPPPSPEPWQEAYELRRLEDNNRSAADSQEDPQEEAPPRQEGASSPQSDTDESEEDDSSEVESSSTSSSCECDSEECPECLKEKKSRALSPDVLIVRPAGEEEPPRRERRSSTIFVPSPTETQYLVPRFYLQSDLMHTGTVRQISNPSLPIRTVSTFQPIDDDVGACRISEEEYIATLSIHDSAKKGDLHVVKLLLKQDIKRMETVDERGWTPLHLAAANGHAEVVKFLGMEGAHLAALDPSGYTALHIAAMNGKHDCIEVLLQMGLGVDLVTSDGFTPLHLAALNGYVECCRTLILWGARVDKRDALGRTVLDMAEEYSLTEIRLLVEGLHRLMEDALQRSSTSGEGSKSPKLKLK